MCLFSIVGAGSTTRYFAIYVSLLHCWCWFYDEVFIVCLVNVLLVLVASLEIFTTDRAPKLHQWSDTSIDASPSM